MNERQRRRFDKKLARAERTVANLEAQVQQYTRVREDGKFNIPRFLFANLATAQGKLAGLQKEKEQLDEQAMVNRLEGLIDGRQAGDSPID